MPVWGVGRFVTHCKPNTGRKSPLLPTVVTSRAALGSPPLQPRPGRAWRFDRASLDDEGERAWLEKVRRESGIDAFASSHTCAPAISESVRECRNGVRITLPAMTRAAARMSSSSMLMRS